MRRLKVLAAAYACDPSRGSEMAVGWGWVTAIARSHDVWVLCADWQRESIDRFVARNRGKFANLCFVYVSPKPWHYADSQWFWRKCESSILKPLVHASYRLWQRDAYAEALELHRSIGFDLTHQLTFVGFRFPGHLWKLAIPFVWGPIGGLENTSWRLLPTMGLRGAMYYGARNVVNSMHRQFLRQPRKAFDAAGPGVIAATSSIQREIRRWYEVNSQVICEVGLPPETADTYQLRANGEPLRLAWSGRHLPGKALNLLLYALGDVPNTTDWRLDIYGDGPCAIAWQRLTARLGIGSRCTWHGQVSRAEALAGLKSAHLFVTTSLKDLTSTVILEALAKGVPVICPDHCGFADVVNEHCGIKIPIGNVREFETGLSRAIVEIARDETMRRRLAEGALLRARDYSWEAKAEAIDRVYDRVLRAACERDIADSRTVIEASTHFSR
jgi:glycosyltransferase involved in cell wall biosynthesis